MEKVTGIGGFFFRAENPSAVAAWYAENLGVDLTPPDYDTLGWQQQAGTTVFEPFPKTTDYFGAMDKQWMINFRVRDLDAIVTQLRNKGIQVKVYEKAQPNGRFAHLADPEGNPIELWEPAGNEAV